MPLNKNELISGLYLTGLLVLVTGLPLGMFLMSIGQIIVFIAWILDGNLLGKVKGFFSKPVTLIISSLFLLHLAGFIWTNDYLYALKDARVKFPLLILPLVFSTSKPLDPKYFLTVIKVFISAVLLATFVSMYILLGFTDKQITDIRDISIFISHIRFGLLICMAIFCSLWIIRNNKKKQPDSQVILLILVIMWLFLFLIILEAVTALVILFLIAFIYGSFALFRNKVKSGIFLFLIPLVVFFWLGWKVNQIYQEVSVVSKVESSSLDSLTSEGRPYILNIPFDDTENGNAIWTYTCPQELETNWPKRSQMNIKGNDKKGQGLYFTIIRYMSSKGLRKDAEGLSRLTDDDIKYIEEGYTNYRFTNTSSLNARIYQIVWEYNHYLKHRKPQGHSVMQRLVFWKTGWQIFLQNPIIGVGTGDVQTAFNEQYQKQHSNLPKLFWLRAHNQYLTFALTFGLVGLTIFLVSIFYPFFKLKKYHDYLYCLFLITVLISFFTEDTLETQAGVTFFAFFNAFLMFHKQEDSIPENKS